MILKRQLRDQNFIKKINDLHRINVALNKCIIVDENFYDDVNLQLPLSKSGEKLFNYLKKKNPSYTDSGLITAIFFDFYNDKLHFDILNVDTLSLIEIISNWIKKGSIKFPWKYGRELYDKYYDDFDKQSESLDADETLRLLDDTSKGVFQIEDLIISPFGMFKSMQSRRIYPSLELLLWHCPDPSCPSFHKVELADGGNKFIDLLESIRDYNYNKDIMDISEVITQHDYDFFDPYSLEGTYELIANAFTYDEHKQITLRILEKEKIRTLLPKELKGSAKDIVKNLKQAECLSLILICEDKVILRHTEDLVNEKIINIPNTEIRQSHILREFGVYDTFLQCNKLGIRVQSNNRELSNLKLKNLLKDIYSDSPLREQLNWSLRRFDQTLSLDQKLDLYINEESPLKIISDTILNGPTQLEKASVKLLCNFTAHNNSDEETFLIEKIAWKLGFNINLYPINLKTFWENLDTFKMDVLSSVIYNEADKAKIRSSAVNFFVSMEEILQQSLSYITWALLSDHYIETKFKYIYEDARNVMVNELNNFEYTEGEFLRLDKSGKNTLFPIVQGFNALIKKCNQLVENSESYKRPLNEFPSFYLNDPLKIFPFEHTKFVLDISPTDFSKIEKFISIVPSEFGKGNLMDVRNRLQHKREDFPIQEEILKSINSAEICISLLENEGIYPNVFLFKKSYRDEYNRSFGVLQNYKGNDMNLTYSPELDGSHLPSRNKPLLSIRSLKLGYTNQAIIFEYKEKSSYQTHWKNYPRKKIKS